MDAILISPIPIGRQLGRVVLTETTAAIMEQQDPDISRALSRAIPILSVKAGVYPLNVQPQNKYRMAAHRTTVPNTKPPPPLLHKTTRPIDTFFIAPTVHSKIKRLHAVISAPKHVKTLPKCKPTHEHKKYIF